MTDEQFTELLNGLTYEYREAEVKSAGPRTSKPLLTQVVRAALGMANRRDGGLIIIGVNEDKPNRKLDPVGLSDADLATWQRDAVADSLAEYADPPIDFDQEVHEYQGKQFVVLQIREFEDVPVLCKKDYSQEVVEPGGKKRQELILRRGACYVRSRRKPETVEIPSHADMRDLLDLAIEKGMRQFIARAYRAGIPLSQERQQTDAELFTEQLQDWSSDFTRQIESRGYWQVVIRPHTFMEERIPEELLYPLLQNTWVDMGGWNFPSLDVARNPMYGEGWISQEIAKPLNGPEAWRFYQSGQFVDKFAMGQDWQDENRFIPPGPGWQPGKLMFVESTIILLTGIFTFASRLALRDQYKSDERLHIEVRAVNIKGRLLYLGADRSILGHESSTLESLYAVDLAREELIATRKEQALRAAQKIFRRFGYESTLEYLKSVQPNFAS